MVTPLGLICAYSASSASVSIDIAMRDTGTCVAKQGETRIA
jgi:hypothetical protein